MRKAALDQFELLATATQSASGTGNAVKPTYMPNAIALVLDVTDQTSAVDDLCDVYVETAYYVGTTANWLPICRFTQLLGNGANNRTLINKVSASEQLPTEMEMVAATPWTLNQGEVVPLLLDELRVRWVITNGAGTHTFDFSVYAIPQ
jgi:hypothetical protein